MVVVQLILGMDPVGGRQVNLLARAVVLLLELQVLLMRYVLQLVVLEAVLDLINRIESVVVIHSVVYILALMELMAMVTEVILIFLVVQRGQNVL